MPKVPMIQRAEEVESIAKYLIGKYHNHLIDAEILYLFTDATRKKCDRVKLGSASKMNSLQRFLSSTMESVESGFELLMLIDSVEWARMDTSERERLIDHELEHIKVFVKSGLKFVRLPEDENKEDYSEFKFGIVAHDLEDFAVIIKRHGFLKSEPEEKFRQEVQKKMPLPEMKVAISRN